VTREELLPLLQQCISARDALPLPTAALEALRSLGAAPAPSAAALRRTVDALGAARTVPEIKVLAARALRELLQSLPPEDPVDKPAPDRRARQLARSARAQERALQGHRQAPEPPARQPIETLSGIGASLGQALRTRGIKTVGDLVWLLPCAYEDERTVTPLTELRRGERQVTEGYVSHVRVMGGGRTGRMAEVWLHAQPVLGEVQLRLTWFRAPPGLLARFIPGARYRVAGMVEEFRGHQQMTHPETQRLGSAEPAAARGIVPRYPSVPGVPPRRLVNFVQSAVQRAVFHIDEAVPAALRREHGLGSLAQALQALHRPAALSDAELLAFNEARSPHHARLAFEEFFLLELALFRRRVEDQGIVAEALLANASPLARVRDAFGFTLTAAQERVTREIFADMGRVTPMRRLLQGDVGCGKTAVAMLAAAQCVAAGAQVAFMAPTEILAEQHFRSLAPLADALGVRAALVLGGERAAHRKKTRKALEEGRIDLAVGTHALLSEGVRFCRLRLVIIDEQHRFGVGQRLRLVDKTERRLAPHLLVMTATPIPRTLALALHGDLEASVIDEMPAGRIPPVTRAYASDERERALLQLERALAAGGQAYVVCPSIEESEDNVGMSAVQTTHAELAQRFAVHGVELLHGRLRPEEKQNAMERFASGQARVLVSTTIVEVGIDVPRANVILIENAERFGLAQLHQLRGRVGRAGQRSACLLVHQAASQESRARIAALCATADGFRIAEDDLQLRGPGELFGHRQSGLPGFRFGDLRRDAPILARAREAAQCVVALDPNLERPEHRAARDMLERSSQGVRSVVREEAG